MAQRFASARHQAVIGTATGYRRWSRFTFSRDGVSRVLEPTSAVLTQDARRGGRWDGRLTFAGDDLLPTRPGDVLTPFGTRLSVELGLELLDGSLSTVPYGTYEIVSSNVTTSASNRTVTVSLADISGTVERYRFESALTVASGTDLGTVVNTVITNRTGINPGVSPVGVALGSARTFGLDVSTPPWSELLDVLKGFSRTAWYDRVGLIQIGSTVPDPASAYPLPALSSFSADFDSPPPNLVVVRGETQDGTAPVQAVAMDTEPSSPTYAGTGPGTSPYGRVTHFYSSPLITTMAQAVSAANAVLAANIGAGATYTVTLPYDPTLSAGDVITLAGTIYVVDAVSLDLAGETTARVRELS